jgi:hypothetical protein
VRAKGDHAVKIDDEYRFREERAEDRRRRDREREPRARSRSARRDIAGRDAFRITLAERGLAVQDGGAVVATGRAPRAATRRSAANHPRGNPAAWVLAGGVSRHGADCACTYCRAPAAPAAPTDAPECGEVEDTDGGGR